jgi:hypothetical protein
MALCGAGHTRGEEQGKRAKEGKSEKKKKGNVDHLRMRNASLPSVNFIGSWYECKGEFRHLFTHMYH